MSIEAETLIIPSDQSPVVDLSEERSARLVSALTNIAESQVILDRDIPDDPEKKQSKKRPLLVEQMHNVYKDHPLVKKERPLIKAIEPSDSAAEDFYRATADWPLLSGREEEKRLRDLIGEGMDAFLKLQSTDVSEPERQQLEEAAIAGTNAYLRFFEGNVRLVTTLVRKMAPITKVSREDLLIAGLNSLPSAIEGFNPDKGFKFSSYADLWVRQGLQKEIRLHDDILLPMDTRDGVRSLNVFCRDFYDKYGHQPTEQDILEAGHSKVVIHARNTVSSIVRLDEKIDDSPDADFYDRFPDYDEGYDRAEMYELAVRVLRDSDLTAREIFIICLRFGLSVRHFYDENEKTINGQYFPLDEKDKAPKGALNLNEIAYMVDLSSERVRQLLNRAKHRLREQWRLTDKTGIFD